MFGLFRMFYSFVFICNGIVILDETRFLAKLGLPLDIKHRNRIPKTQQKIVEIIKAIRTVCGLPLIAINLLCIVYEIFLG